MSFEWHSETYRGYTIKIVADDHAGNPIQDCDELINVVLYEKAERRFGWTTDDEYARLLTYGMDNVCTAKNLQQALTIVCRWLKAFHGVTVALPIGAYDHSGVSVYIGDGPVDAGGWDSGWVGLILDTPERRKVMGFDEPGNEPASFSGKPWNHPDTIEAALRQDFRRWQAWVQHEVVGYVVEDGNGARIEDGSSFGYYGDDEWRKTEENPHGFMQAEARVVIDGHINQLHEQALAEQADRDDEAAEAAADEQEIAEIRLAEVGVR